MAIVFYLLGWIGILGGLAWVGLIALGATKSAQEAGTAMDGAFGLTVFAAASPGLGALVSGLLVLAAAGVLARLDRLIRVSQH